MRTLVILIDGMRPDALVKTAAAAPILEKARYTLSARTVMPSVTLPCHMSLFHSVEPSRHGTTTNTYAPQVRPVNGLCEVLHQSKRTCAFFYNWEQLRDLSRPGSLLFSYYCRGGVLGYNKANAMVTDAAIDFLGSNPTDFAFLYYGYPDSAGHKYGWMTDEYMDAMENSWENISRILQTLPEDYAVIITADHGGHDRIHGTDLPEDMTIPLILLGSGFPADICLDSASILDIAPTVTQLLGAEPDEEWEGKSLV